MDEFDKLRIIRNLTYLKEELPSLSDLSNVMDYLVTQGIWTMERRNEIMDCHSFITSLLKSGPLVYKVFIESLIKFDKQYIADKLQRTHVGDMDTDGNGDRDLSCANGGIVRYVPVKASGAEGTELGGIKDELIRKVSDEFTRIRLENDQGLRNLNEGLERKLEDEFRRLCENHEIERKNLKESIERNFFEKMNDLEANRAENMGIMTCLVEKVNRMCIANDEDRDILRETVQKLDLGTEKYEQLRLSYSGLKQQLNDQQSRNSNLHQEVVNLNKQKEETEQELKALKEKEENDRSIIEDLRKKLDEKEQEIQLLKSQRQLLQSKVDTMKNTPVKIEKMEEVEKLRKDKGEIIKQLKDKEEQLQKLTQVCHNLQDKQNKIIKQLKEEMNGKLMSLQKNAKSTRTQRPQDEDKLRSSVKRSNASTYRNMYKDRRTQEINK